jgi:hypothetical protein
MKKIFNNIKTLAALLMVGAAFTACSNSDDSIIEQSENVKTYKLTIQASREDIQPSTRAAFEQYLDGNITVKWTLYDVYAETDADIVGVYTDPDFNYGIGTLSPSEVSHDGEIATLTGYLTTYGISNGDKLYLKIEDIKDDTPYYHNYYTTQTGKLNEIAAEYYKAEATVTVGNFYGGYDISTTGPAVFQSKQAIVKFTLKNSGNDLVPTENTMTVTVSGADSQTYKIKNAGDTNVVYVAMDGFTGANNVQLTCQSGGKSYTYTQYGVTFKNGEFYPVNVNMNEL